MKTLTKEDARALLNGKLPDEFVAQLADSLEVAQGTYSAPANSGVQIALSKLFAYLLFEDSPVCLYVTGWGVANEQPDLFNRYRQSLGETRPLMEAAFHVFERTDEEAFISVLCMVLFFSWDASVFDLAGRSLLQTSHDGWL
jgi:hypothetical protein